MLLYGNYIFNIVICTNILIILSFFSFFLFSGAWQEVVTINCQCIETDEDTKKLFYCVA